LHLLRSNGSTYYWVGTTQKLGPSALSEGISLYKSTDLGNWTWVGGAPIFRNTSIVAPAPGPEGYRIERPKLVQCPGTGKYVIWFHLDTASFSLQRVGVLQSDSLESGWEWVGSFQPDGQPSYDMTLFDDSQGSGAIYLVRSVRNQFAGFSRLSADCLDTTGIVSSGPQIEGQAVFRLTSAPPSFTQSMPFLWGSHLTGWSPNPAVFSVADQSQIDGAKWDQLGNPSNNPTTYNSQSTFILPLPTGQQVPLLLYMSDRWNDNGPGGVSNASYVWLPLLWNTTSKSWNLPWYNSWRLGDFINY
jgi:hypothetical protein